MRTKFYLTALCLPLAFAACTSEDLMPEGVQMPQRQQINVTLTAEKPGIGADSRLSIDEENNFLWEKDADMIGAALTDGASFNTPADEILVNYPFTADNSAKASTFSGKSSVTEGTYFFYYGYQDILDRGKLSLNVPAQTYDVDAEKSAKEQAVSYMKMISPLVKLSGVTYEDAQSYNIPLEFVNLYTLVRVQVSSENIPDGMTPKVTKVTLNANGTEFVKEATADIASTIATVGTSGYDANGVWQAASYAANKVSLAAKVNDGSIYSTTGIVRGPAEVAVDGDLPLDEANATDVYILAPKGTYTNGLKLTVETSEGVYTRDITSQVVLGDNIQPIAASLNFAQDGSGNVILPTSFDINSASDWNNAVQFMTDHSVGYLNKTVAFKLKKSIEIANMPIFNLTIDGTAYNHVNLGTGLASNNSPTLTLSSNYTISDENYNQFTITNGVKLGVAAGATLTVKNKNVAFSEIVNQGILNINTDAQVTTPIVNLATANINGGSTIDNLQNGRAANPSAGVAKIEGTLYVAAGKTTTVSNLDSQAGTIDVPSTSKLTVAAGSNAALISVNGELDGTFSNSGIVDNYGKLSATVTNTGTVKVEKNSVSDNDVTVTDGTVEIVDVTDFSALQGSQDRATSHYVFSGAKVTTIVTNGAEFANADNCSDINDITLATGTWNLMAAVTSPSTADKNIVVPTNATSLTLDAATLNLGVVLTKDINVTGASAFTASAAMTVTGNLTVVAGATMAVGANVTMNAAEQTNTETATINGALTVNPGAAMYFNTASVGTAGNLTVMGQSAVAAAIFGVQTTLSNAGLVESKAATVAGGAAGKVSQPINTATGTFKGNADNTIVFN